jgi:hypothetical protein
MVGPTELESVTSTVSRKNPPTAYRHSHCKQKTSAIRVCGKSAGIVRDSHSSAGIVRDGKSLLGRVGSLPASSGTFAVGNKKGKDESRNLHQGKHG